MGVKLEVLLNTLTLIFLIALMLFFAAPLTWLILSAINPHATGPVFEIPERPSLENFKSLLRPIGEVVPLTWILNSTVISLATAALTTLLSILGAFVLTRFGFKGQEHMLMLFVVFRLIPPILVALPLMTIFKAWGLMNSIPALILVLSSLIMPFTLLMLEGYFRAIPPIYEEAALIDGCTRIGAFLRITLPLARPGIIAVFLLAFVSAWSEFVIPLFLITSPHLMPASVGLYFFYGEYGRVEYGRLSAFSVLYALPILVVFFITQRHLRRGIAGLVTR